MTNEINNLAKQVDLLEFIRKDTNSSFINEGNWIKVVPCPLCGTSSEGDSDHFKIKKNENSFSTFNPNCKAHGGTIIDYLIYVKGYSKHEAIEEVKEMLGVENEFKTKNSTSNIPTTNTDMELQKNLKNVFTQLKNTSNKEELQYFTDRGLSDETIKRFDLIVGYLPSDKVKRAIIPIKENGEIVGYNARAVSDKDKPKYRKPSGMTGKYFNIDHLKELNKDEVIFLTEGEFDALALEEVGFNAIAIGGANNTNKIKEIATGLGAFEKYNIFTAFDNDEAGKKASENIEAPRVKIPSNYNDINEWYLEEGKEEFKKNMIQQIETLTLEANKPDSNLAFLNNKFIKAVEETQAYSKRKTGFRELDKHIQLLPSLITIGGASGLGKTTFAYQLADQLAEQGEEVIFFSLEMGAFEMITKSIARNTVLTDDNRLQIELGATGKDIRTDNLNEAVRGNVAKATHRYSRIANRVSIVEGNFNTDIDFIENYTKKYIEKNNVKPVIMVDYLQVIPKRKDDTSEIEKIDNAVIGLKRISRDLGITVIVLSSLNRANYFYPVAFESFKGSGGIEYTSDIVLGMQLQVLEDDDFISSSEITKKRKMVEEALREQPRKISIVGLKNRSGASGFNINYSYYSKYDLFIEDIPTISKEEVKSRWI